MTISVMITAWMTKMISKSSESLYSNELVHQVVYLVKHKNDYARAAEVMNKNFITLDVLSRSTMKLTQLELARLADILVENRR